MEMIGKADRNGTDHAFNFRVSDSPHFGTKDPFWL